MLKRWNSLSLARQFLFAGVAVSLLAMLAVGALVAEVIERSFIRHAAAATALYVDSMIAPVLPDLRTAQRLDDVAAHSLDETLGAGKLGKRLVSFRLWRRDGTILYASTPELVGKRFEPSPNLDLAFSGQVVGEYGEVDDAESSYERSLGAPLLEIYSPILQPWSGEVVAVSEFYERAPDLPASLADARMKGWIAVAVVTLGLFFTLAGIVLRGSSTIEAQRVALKQRIEDLALLAETNEALAARLQTASEQATAFNERFLKRLGADLHDGPAQLVAFAALRLGSRALRDRSVPTEDRDEELAMIRASLADAMEEIRVISGGLALPHIETADMKEVLKAAVKTHEQRTRTEVALRCSADLPCLEPAEKICIFRFVQEALSNSFRHAGGKGATVRQRWQDDRLVIEVSDDGPGFDPGSVPGERLGLACLRQRVESVGGSMEIESSPSGTRVSMALDVVENREAAVWAA
jgi:signal transduction histidine kinase